MSFFPAPLSCGAVLFVLAAAPVFAESAPNLDQGREIFSETAEPNCAICHTLADAGAVGKVGPNLDELKPDAEKIRAAVTSGVGVMPAFDESLTEEQIETVVNYVAAVVGKPVDATQAAPAEETVEEVSEADAPAAATLTAEGSEILAMGDAAAGEKVFRKCKSCHTVDQGGADRVGPNLYGIVGDAVARAESYKYSGAMSAHGGEWTPALLAEFLADPRGSIKGTKMGFAGLRKEQDRADVIAYLDAQSDAPLAAAD